MSFILSKSTYIRGLQCEKSLFLNKFKKKERDVLSEEKKIRFEGGRTFEDDFRATLGEGVNIAKENPNQFFKYAKITSNLISLKEKLIFEATFVFDDVLVMVDALRLNENGTYTAYEVKNSPEIKEVHKNDLGIQYYVVKHSIENLESFNLVLNGGDGFKIIDLKNEVGEIQPKIPQNVANLKGIIANKTEPIQPMGDQCHNPYDCDFLGYCGKSLF
ncbi:MAG: hypothetical protein ACI81S_000556 [Sphingobacteriales bacterium]|jgi:hypothetical protein